MSERFVRGWKLSVAKLAGLIGTGAPTAAEVLRSEANAKCLDDVLASLGRGHQADGAAKATQALEDIFRGVPAKERAADYARVTELCLNHLGEPLAVAYETEWREPTDQIVLQVTYDLPNDTHGRWNPVLEACGLTKLAATWAQPNLDFPWASGQAPERGRWPWPVWTVVGASMLGELEAELGGLSRATVDALPDECLADPVSAEWAASCREELWLGLDRLRAWVVSARAATLEPTGLAVLPSANDLVLLMDGDQ
ncbi:MAG: hypothetical protein IPG50_30610 [Myxococcales bacterium]|nr:hypothetical protein [Myxococcales bacterium]